MWRIAIRSAAVVAAVMLGSPAGAEDQASVDDSSKATQLAFDDARSASVQGRLVGKDKHEYTFDARKGQKVVLEVSSDLSSWIGIDLLAPVFASTVRTAPAIYTNFIDGTTRWEGVAPGNGTYTVRLGLLRSQVQKVGRVDYELDVNIK
jgi:hypothetical protein